MVHSLAGNSDFSPLIGNRKNLGEKETHGYVSTVLCVFHAELPCACSNGAQTQEKHTACILAYSCV